MEERGQGETVDFPPPPVIRRRISNKSVTGSPTGTGTDNPVNQVNALPSTIHVSSVGVEGNVDVTAGRRAPSSSLKSKMIKLTYAGLGFLAILTSLGLILDYYDLWDPCSVKIPYQRQCTVDSFLGGLFQRAELTEESFCLLPGVFHTAQNSGWNMDCTQGIDLVVEQPVPK